MNTQEIKNLASTLTSRVLKVKFLNPTVKYGDRVQIKDTHYNKTTIIEWNYSFNNCIQVALNYLINDRNIEILNVGYNDKKNVYYITIPFNSNQIK